MRRRLLPAVALLVVLIAPETATTFPWEGYASRYDEGVFEGVVALRFREGWWRNEPPADWHAVAGFAATTNCDQVGRVLLMRPVGAARWERVLVADCAGADGTLDWMVENRIIAELDYGLWSRWAGEHGVPLAIEMRPEGAREGLRRWVV